MSTLGINLRKNFLRQMKRLVRRRHAAINGAVQQHFLNFFARHLIIQCSAHVHTKFFAAIERDQHRKRQQAARMARKTGTRPDFAPRVARDQILKRLGERFRGRFGPVHMRVTQNCAAHFHSCGMTLTLVHYFASCCSRKFSSAAVKGSAASIFERCAAFSSRCCAPGIFSATNRPSTGGVAVSCVPEITSVGRLTREIASRRSSSRSAAHVAAYPSGGVCSSICRAASTCAGARFAKSSVNQRATTPFAIGAMPPSLTAAMRVFQPSAVPMRAAVLHSVKLLKRFAAWMPSHWPIKPLTEIPQ